MPSYFPPGRSLKLPNYFSVDVPMTSATWNTVAAHEIITVTGSVHIQMILEITGTITSVGGNATLILGDETTTNSLIASTDAEALAAGEWWADATATRTIIDDIRIAGLDFIVSGKDIGYTIGTEAFNGGNIIFHVYWEEIGNPGGTCVAGAGGVL